VTGLAALTLGLLIATANSSFEEKSKEIKHEATNAILVDRLLRDYGPQADRAREELRIAVQNELDRMNEARRPGVDAKQIFGTVRSGNIRSEILKLSPNNDREAWLKTTALAAAQDFVTSRWRIYHEMNSSIKWPLVYVAVFWIAAIFFSLGIKTPRNIFPVGGMLIASLAMAGAMYLMLKWTCRFRASSRFPPLLSSRLSSKSKRLRSQSRKNNDRRSQGGAAGDRAQGLRRR
jgi:hypothetical protein